jgi:hypothetical protein
LDGFDTAEAAGEAMHDAMVEAVAWLRGYVWGHFAIESYHVKLVDISIHIMFFYSDTLC